MVNIRKFDEEDVLHQILYTFWRKGYDATSLDDLVEATGVKRQSLYNAFGNKDEMFLLVYQRYLHRTMQAMRAVSDVHDIPVAQAMHHMLTTLMTEIVNPDSPPGCFIANTTVEFADKDHPITAKLKEHYHEVEALLEQVIRDAQARNKLSHDKDPTSLARFLIANITSIAVLFRLNRDPEFAKNIVDEMVKVFD